MNLENRIVSSTPPDRLPRRGFSLFFVRLVDIKPALLIGKNDPLRNGYLKALLCRALKVPGFINPLPRKGTETPCIRKAIGLKFDVHQSTTPQGDGNTEAQTL